MEFLFISIPRTGTQSLRSVLPNQPNHISIKKFNKDKYFSFCFIREPIERIFSWFVFHKINHPNLPCYKTDFENWVFSGLPHHWRNYRTSGVTSPLRQFEFIMNTNNKIEVDFIGVFEKFQEQATIMLNVMGINQKIPHIGKIEKPIFSISDECRDFLEERFKNDFDVYRYYTEFWKNNSEIDFIQNRINEKEKN